MSAHTIDATIAVGDPDLGGGAAPLLTITMVETDAAVA